MKKPHLLPLLATAASAAGSAQRNILFIAVDDLRPEINAYGHSFMKTPAMDKLAGQGVLFQRAYVQYSFCAPSRNSFMTGRRPDATKAWSFMDHFRERGIGENWTSMPQYFRQQGYLTLGAGKLFHPGLPPSFDAPKSWDHFTWAGGCSGTTNGWPVLEKGVDNVDCPPGVNGCPKEGTIEGDSHWCKIDVSKLVEPLADDVIANATIQNLKKAKDSKQPFFIGCGFHKPHLPFHFPSEFDIYPPADQIAPPLHPNPPEGMPMVAWHEAGFNNAWGKPCNNSGVFRRAYYSAVSYTDSLIGKVLDAVDALELAASTAVALMGDHGWQLGEMNEWKKMTNFELGVRVPLIFRAPWLQTAGVKTPALAEAVDLFPTFVDLAGLPAVPASEHLQGASLVPVLANPPTSGTGIRDYAFSQFAKRNTTSKELKRQEPWDVCTTCKRNDIDYMGYSARGDRWRFTEWVAWNKTSFTPIWSETVGRELYDHDGDCGADFDKATPTKNLASDPARASVVDAMLRVVQEQFKNDHLPPSWLA